MNPCPQPQSQLLLLRTIERAVAPEYSSKTRNLVQSQVRLTAIASHFLDSGEISVIALQSLWICDAIDSQSHARIALDSELNYGS